MISELQECGFRNLYGFDTETVRFRNAEKLF